MNLDLKHTSCFGFLDLVLNFHMMLQSMKNSIHRPDRLKTFELQGTSIDKQNLQQKIPISDEFQKLKRNPQIDFNKTISGFNETKKLSQPSIAAEALL